MGIFILKDERAAWRHCTIKRQGKVRMRIRGRDREKSRRGLVTELICVHVHGAHKAVSLF